MRLIDRKLRRDLWEIKGRVAALGLIIASGVGILFGVSVALQNLLSTQDTVFAQLNFADLEVQLLPEDVQNLPTLERVEGVAQVESRLAMPSRIALLDGGSLSGLVLFQDKAETRINQLSMLQGRAFVPGTDEVVVDMALAEYHGYGIGDQIEVSVGRKKYSFVVAGIAMSPEFLITSSNPDYVIAEPGSLGVVWADIGQLRDVLGFTMINSLLFRFEEQADREAVTDRILSLLSQANLEKVIPSEESYSYKAIRMDVAAFRVYSPAIIVTLCLLAIAMGIITFRRFVVERQQEFGVLVALGYRRGSIGRALLLVGMRIGLLGGLAGLVVGWGLGWAFAEVYAEAMHLPVVVHSFDPVLAITALGFGVATGCLSLMAASAPMLRATPRELTTSASIAVGEKASSHFRHLPVVLRYGLRALLRDRLLTAGAVLAMGGAVAVAISYGLAMTSIFRTVEQSFNQEQWKYAVDFQYPLYIDEAEALVRLPEVRQFEHYYRTAADMRSESGHSMGLLVGMAIPNRMRELDPAQGRTIEGEGEAVVSRDLARDLGLELGDRFSIHKGSVAEPVTIVGITNDIFLRTVTVALPVVQRLAQAESKVTGLYLDGEPAAYSKLIADTEQVARVTDKNRLIEHFRGEIAEMTGIVYITIVFSIGVSILFVTTLVYLGVSEKRAEFAILRSQPRLSWCGS